MAVLPSSSRSPSRSAIAFTLPAESPSDITHRHDPHLNDLTGPTDIAHRGARGGSLIVHMSYEKAGIPVDAVRSALPRLRSSPLLPIVRHHLVQVQSHLDSLSTDAAVAGSVGSATVELTRGLVFSAAGHRREREVLHETLKTRVRTYVLRHLDDPLLTVDRIAEAHHVSRRTLYKIWGDEELPLMEWIMRERLANARGDLSDPGRTSTIAVIARRWGFSDAAHFARRFRAQYGMSPSTWRSGDR